MISKACLIPPLNPFRPPLIYDQTIFNVLVEFLRVFLFDYNLPLFLFDYNLPLRVASVGSKGGRSLGQLPLV